MWEKLGEPLLPVLERALDVNLLRQQVIANNIANADTPNYKRWDVIFANKLSEVTESDNKLALAQTNPRHINIKNKYEIEPTLIQVNQSSSRNDGNNVDIESELVQQTETLLNYNFLTRLVTDHLDMLRIAITEGRR